ncbi:hypothetical protein OIY81_3676, partial [Cryptosporidium canis]
GVVELGDALNEDLGEVLVLVAGDDHLDGVVSGGFDAAGLVRAVDCVLVVPPHQVGEGQVDGDDEWQGVEGEEGRVEVRVGILGRKAVKGLLEVANRDVVLLLVVGANPQGVVGRGGVFVDLKPLGCPAHALVEEVRDPKILLQLDSLEQQGRRRRHRQAGGGEQPDDPPEDDDGVVPLPEDGVDVSPQVKVHRGSQQASDRLHRAFRAGVDPPDCRHEQKGGLDEEEAAHCDVAGEELLVPRVHVCRCAALASVAHVVAEIVAVEVNSAANVVRVLAKQLGVGELGGECQAAVLGGLVGGFLAPSILLGRGRLANADFRVKLADDAEAKHVDIPTQGLRRVVEGLIAVIKGGRDRLEPNTGPQEVATHQIALADKPIHVYGGQPEPDLRPRSSRNAVQKPYVVMYHLVVWRLEVVAAEHDLVGVVNGELGRHVYGRGREEPLLPSSVWGEGRRCGPEEGGPALGTGSLHALKGVQIVP